MKKVIVIGRSGVQYDEKIFSDDELGKISNKRMTNEIGVALLEKDYPKWCSRLTVVEKNPIGPENQYECETDVCKKWMKSKIESLLSVEKRDGERIRGFISGVSIVLSLEDENIRQMAGKQLVRNAIGTMDQYDLKLSDIPVFSDEEAAFIDRVYRTFDPVSNATPSSTASVLDNLSEEAETTTGDSDPGDPEMKSEEEIKKEETENHRDTAGGLNLDDIPEEANGDQSEEEEIK
jgi:hypothetical protein